MKKRFYYFLISKISMSFVLSLVFVITLNAQEVPDVDDYENVTDDYIINSGTDDGEYIGFISTAEDESALSGGRFGTLADWILKGTKADKSFDNINSEQGTLAGFLAMENWKGDNALENEQIYQEATLPAGEYILGIFVENIDDPLEEAFYACVAE